MKKHAIISIILFQVVFCFGLKLQDGDILYWALMSESWVDSSSLDKGHFELVVDTCRIVNDTLRYTHPKYKDMHEEFEFWQSISFVEDTVTIKYSVRDTVFTTDSLQLGKTFNNDDSILIFEEYEHYSRKNWTELRYSKKWGIKEIVSKCHSHLSNEPDRVDVIVLIAVKQGEVVYPTVYSDPVSIKLHGPEIKAASKNVPVKLQYELKYPENVLHFFYYTKFLCDTVPELSNPSEVILSGASQLLNSPEYYGKPVYWTLKVGNTLSNADWVSNDILQMVCEEGKDITITFPENNSTIYTSKPLIHFNNRADSIASIVIENEEGDILVNTNKLSVSPLTKLYDCHYIENRLPPGSEFFCTISYQLNDESKLTSTAFSIAKRELLELLEFTSDNSGLEIKSNKEYIRIDSNSLVVKWYDEFISYDIEEQDTGAISFNIKEDKLEVVEPLFYRYWNYNWGETIWDTSGTPKGVCEKSDSNYVSLWTTFMKRSMERIKGRVDTTELKVYNFLNELNTAKYDDLHTNTLKTVTLKSAPLSFTQTKNVLHFNAKENMTVELYSVQGRLIMSKDLRKSIKTQSIDLSPYSNNVYLLRIKNEQFSKVHKLRL